MLAAILLLASAPKEIDLSKQFAPYQGCFLIREIKTGREAIYNPKRVAQRFSPCSTFKIPNTMIGLDAKVVAGKDTLFKWDGTPQTRKECARDHTLESAFKASVVWYYQRLAREVGKTRMQEALDRLGYGNRDISGGIDRFWLQGSLRISAREQVAFLERLYEGKVPFTPQAQSIIKQIMLVEPGLSGKTGSNGSGLGWFVGSLERDGRRYVFAANMEGKGADGLKTRAICKTILKGLKLP